jgi:hypothetical protein
MKGSFEEALYLPIFAILIMPYQGYRNLASYPLMPNFLSPKSMLSDTDSVCALDSIKKLCARTIYSDVSYRGISLQNSSSKELNVCNENNFIIWLAAVPFSFFVMGRNSYSCKVKAIASYCLSL